MRFACQIAIVVVAIVSTSGCEKPPASNADAQARMDAALAIDNPSQRDKALSQACRDAAKGGFGDTILRAVNRIGDPALRDAVEVDCATALRDAGQVGAATDVAKRIENPSKRDEILKRLSSGS